MFVKTPKNLFLIDGLGALLSAFMLGIVLVQFERFIGIPPSTLYILAIPPVLFAGYDFFCYRNSGARTSLFLRGIAIMNMLYCCLSIGFAIFHKSTITGLGWTYITLEILIVIALAVLEIKGANRLEALD